MIQEFESRHFDVNFAEDDSFNCSFAEDEEFVVEFGAGIEKEYHGVYEVTPSEQTQTLQTTNRVLTDNVTVNPIPEQYIVPEGTLEITENDDYDVKQYASVDVNINRPLQSKSLDPDESAHTITPDTGYYGLDQVDVSAVSSTYVGSDIPRRSSTDVTVNGPTVSAPDGYYSESVSKTVASGSATTPTTSIQATPSIDVDSSTGVITALNASTKNITPTVTAGYVTSGTAGTVSVTGTNTKNLPTQAGAILTPTTSQQTAVAAGKFTTGAVKIDPIPSSYIIPSGTKNITANGSNIDVKQYEFADVAVPGPVLQTVSKSYTPTESQQTETITPGAGYDALEEVDISVGAISSTYVGSGIARKDSSNLSASGATVTAPAGYYASNATKTVASGTEGTPTATKGTVSSHSVSVTPSVTNTAGYISGGTHNGTAVSVSASELVSGTYTVDSSGTKDVTNYASASVPAGTAGTPALTVSAVENHAKTIRSSVINSTGWITGGTVSGASTTVSASDLVSGSETKTANGTYDVTNLAEMVVNVSGGGGASNIVTGTFQYSTTSAAAQTITLDYSGNGYPIVCAIVLDDGVLDSTYTNTVARYSIAQYFMTKTYTGTAPTFTTSGDANQGAVATVYKSSTSTAATLTRTSSATVNTFSSSAATGSTTTCVRFTSKTKMSIYSGANSGTSRYGFFSGKKYRYWIIYSA